VIVILYIYTILLQIDGSVIPSMNGGAMEELAKQNALFDLMKWICSVLVALNVWQYLDGRRQRAQFDNEMKEKIKEANEMRDQRIEELSKKIDKYESK